MTSLTGLAARASLLADGSGALVQAGCIPPEMIMQKLTMELLKKLDDSIKAPVLQEAAHFEHRLQMGSKPIFHLEAFAAKVMAIFKKWSVEMNELLEAMDE